MSKWSAVAGVLLCVLCLSILGLTGAGAGSSVKDRIELPASLAKHYPPESKTPVFYLKMLAMSQTFSAIIVDAMEGDTEYAKNHFNSFKEQFVAFGEMVPEWKRDFESAPFVKLRASLDAQDSRAVLKAAEAFHDTCSTCHYHYMAPVQLKFRWMKVENMMVDDPVLQESMPYAPFKLALEGNFTGIGLDLKQGQPDRAVQHLDQFKQRMATLKETCMECHDTERHYFVDADVMGVIGELETLLQKPSPEAGEVGKLMTRIGRESCEKCHQVHVPGVYSTHFVK